MKPIAEDTSGTWKTPLSGDTGIVQDGRRHSGAAGNQPGRPSGTSDAPASNSQANQPPQLVSAPEQATSQLILNVPPGQRALDASQPSLQAPESAGATVQGPENFELNTSGNLAPSSFPNRLPTQSNVESVTDKDRSYKDYRNALDAWVISAELDTKAAQEVKGRINAYLAAPEAQKRVLDLSRLKLSTLPPLPADLEGLDVSWNKLSALPEKLPKGLQKLCVSWCKKLTALPTNLPQGLLDLDANSCLNLTALPENLPRGLQTLRVGESFLKALPKNLPQGLQELDVWGCRKLTALPKNLPPSLRILKVTSLYEEALVTLIRTNPFITELRYTEGGLDKTSKSIIEAELEKNRKHPARIPYAAASLDLLTRLAFTTSEQTGDLIGRASTPNPLAGSLPNPSIPAELHDVLAEHCSKDVVAMLAGMVDTAV